MILEASRIFPVIRKYWSCDLFQTAQKCSIWIAETKYTVIGDCIKIISSMFGSAISLM